MNSPGGDWDFSGLTADEVAEIYRLLRRYLGERGSEADFGRLTEEDRAKLVDILRHGKAPSKEARAEIEAFLTGAKPPTEEEQAEADGIPTEEDVAKEVFESYRRRLDALSELEFLATLHIRTPLEVLEHHGELFTGPPSKAPRYGTEADGMWVPRVEWKDLGLGEPPEGTHASDVGPVRPSEYLLFLRDFRRIVEQEATVQEKVAALKRLPARSATYARFWKALSGKYKGFPESFVEQISREG